MVQAKNIFRYLYEVTDYNPRQILEGKDAEQAVKLLYKIISSLLLRNNLFFSKNGAPFYI